MVESGASTRLWGCLRSAGVKMRRCSPRMRIRLPIYFALGHLVFWFAANAVGGLIRSAYIALHNICLMASLSEPFLRLLSWIVPWKPLPIDYLWPLSLFLLPTLQWMVIGFVFGLLHDAKASQETDKPLVQVCVICGHRAVAPTSPICPGCGKPTLEAATDSSDVPCPKCGYNLTGNMSGRCPECGEVY